eukprot:1034695-Rhodomonas_salina.1
MEHMAQMGGHGGNVLLEDGQGHRDHLIARSTDRHTYSAASASNDILHGLYADREVGKTCLPLDWPATTQGVATGAWRSHSDC